MKYVFVVGENETLMETCACFAFMESPPILGIANGCAPILYNHTHLHMDSIFELVMRDLETGNLPLQPQMKMSMHKNCQPLGEAVCQIEITRGLNPAILMLNLYLHSSCSNEKIKIGQFQGDGLLFFTPMGSYCKSMSLNCPLMERTMESITITAICPLSMRFRTLTLPANSRIFLQIDPHCRTDTAEIYVDDLDRHMQLRKGEELSIRMSRFHINMVSNLLVSN
jgi:NAD kinase